MYSLAIPQKSLVRQWKNIAKGCCGCHQRNVIAKHPTVRLAPLLLTPKHCYTTNIQWLLPEIIRTSSLAYVQTNTRGKFSSGYVAGTNRPHSAVFVRRFYAGPILRKEAPLKPSSKVEETVQAIKSKLKEGEKPPDAPVPVKVKKTIRQRIVDEVLHYYHGFRLLFIDIKISLKLSWRILQGKSLTRREHRLLVRTVSDLFRLVPFSVFIIVPFMELLLPVAIKLFPGMLPSTFQTAREKEDKMKQALKVKLEMAKFLQKTLDDMAVQGKGHKSERAKEFHDFFLKVRTSGEQATNEEIMKFSKLFEDEITLDSLSRAQLTALCRVLEIQPIGTNNFLRFQLRMRLRSLAADDKVIQKEGIDSLSLAELQQACRARGMRAYGMSEERMKLQLAQWLDLSLNKKVPPSLLLLSRALLLPDTIPTSDQLKATISSLPDTLVTQTEAAIGEREGKIDNKMKIEVIREEERKIKEERQEMREELKKTDSVKKETEEICDKAPVMTSDTGVIEIPAVDVCTKEGLKKEELSSIDFEKLEDALDSIGKEKKKLLVEKEELDDLKEELAEYQEDVDELRQVVKSTHVSKAELKETKAAKRLFNKVNNMINKMDCVLQELEREEQQLKKDLEAKEELEEKESKQKTEQLVSIEELISAIRQIQKVPDDSFIEQISEVLAKIDADRDGSLRVDDVLKVIELVAAENVKLNKKQIDEIVELIKKEELIELEEQMGKVLEKGATRRTATQAGETCPDNVNKQSCEVPAAAVTASKAPGTDKNCKKL
ncbi:mitochondrial proton/calcium exchanger protein [Schistocerca serialis cubense]|uniref:mitochondrial proton/calcium exchanger protein n=1 Tax=Schistocerca serialis cubense TaxID=2023355 RepID=UPI00214F2AD5|nr:mitochondrial proton/calcium exchanger protein [Schistocerca serialis cubense]